MTMREQFLLGADVVLTAVTDRRVAEAWDDNSVLAFQTVGSLAGHLARGSVWAVGEYLDADEPDGDVDFETAAEYFTKVMEQVTADDHVAIRERGAAIAQTGHDAVVSELASRLAELHHRLPNEKPDRLVAVFAGRIMRLDDYLWTRIVEQVVHLDDLARSIGVEPWPNPDDAAALVVSCGAEVGRRRYGDSAMIRTLYRNLDPTLPVF